VITSKATNEISFQNRPTEVAGSGSVGSTLPPPAGASTLS
jgi:hypothetical protein